MLGGGGGIFLKGRAFQKLDPFLKWSSCKEGVGVFFYQRTGGFTFTGCIKMKVGQPFCQKCFNLGFCSEKEVGLNGPIQLYETLSSKMSLPWLELP